MPVAGTALLLEAIARLGVDVPALLRRTAAGFTIDDLASGRVQKLNRATFAGIYREAMLTIEAEATRKSGRPPTTPDDYGLMWQSAISCRTLGAVIERVVAFSRMLEGRMGSVSTEIEAGMLHFRLDPMRVERNPTTFLTELIGMAMFDRMFSWLIGERLPIERIEFDYPPEYEQHIVHGLTDRPIALGFPATEFQFPSALADCPVIRTPEELDALQPLSPLSFVAEPNARPFTTRLAQILDDAIARSAELPAGEELAEALRCSSATLHRRLRSEGTTLQAIKDDRRRDWAIELLRRRANSISEISVRVGFSDETAFRRAFHRWTGKPPSAFRA